MVKIIKPDSDKNLLKRASGAIIETAATTTPGLLIGGTDVTVIAPALATGGLLLAKALYGNAMELRSKRVEEFVRFIMNNPKQFRGDILRSEEFQDGFVNTLQEYLTLRTEQKRRLLRNVFKDFAGNLDKSNFQLERFTDTIQKISPAGVALLAFIQETILPYRKEFIRRSWQDKNLGDKPIEWWIDRDEKSKPLSDALSMWVSENYGIHGAAMKKKYGIDKSGQIPQEMQEQINETENTERERLFAPINELTYLGLGSTGIDSGLGWGGITAGTWTLTSFAYEFIKHITNP